MTMPDRIRQSVQAAVDRPVDADELLRRIRSGTQRRRGWAAPVAAAAAVVVVAGGAGVVLQDRQSPVGPAGGGHVPFVQQEASEADVPAPDIMRSSGGGAATLPCTTQTVRGRITWTASDDSPADLVGQARISLADGAVGSCSMGPEDPSLVLLGPADGPVGPDSVFQGQPYAPLPPRTPGRVVDRSRDVVVPLWLTGSNCVPASFGSLAGMAPPLLEINFEGDRLPCDSSRPQADGALTVGLPRTEGVPAGLLPADRKNLNVALDAPPSSAEGEPLRYQVRLSNPTDADIALDPCPAYQAVYTWQAGVGSTQLASGGRLNCRAAPSAVPAGGEVVFEMVQHDPAVGDPGPGRAAEVEVEVQWGIAGPSAASATVRLSPPPDEAAEGVRTYTVQPAVKTVGNPRAEEQRDACFALPGVKAVGVDERNEPRVYRVTVPAADAPAFEQCIAAVVGLYVPELALQAGAVPSDGPEQDGIKAAPRMRIAETDEFGVLVLVPGQNEVTVDADRVDMLSGAEAEAAARARGDDVSNDYYLVNDNPRLRRYRFAPDAVVWGSIRMTGTVERQQRTVEDLVAFLRTPAAKTTLFHLDVENGVVIAAEEQYRP